MLRPKRVNNGTTGAGRIFRAAVVAGLVFGWSRPAFPNAPSHLQLAPIRIGTSVGGNIGYTYLSNTFGSSTSSQQLLDVGVRFGVRAQSYFWQPWFARVNGTMGIAVSANSSNSSNAPATKSGGEVITGDAALNLLQYSRFPFLAHIYRQNTQTSGALSGINSNYLITGLDLNQNYRSLNGRLDGLVNFAKSNSGRTNIGTENASKQLNFTLTSQYPLSHQTFRVVGAATQQDQPLAGHSNSSDTLVTNHLFQPNSALSVASFLNLIKTSNSITPVTSPQQQQDYASQQLSSFSSWRPEESPLTMTSSVRLLKSNISNNGVAATQFEDTNLNLGANYAWSRFLRMYGGVNVNDNSGIQTVSTNAALSAQRGFGEQDTTDIGGFRYTRSAGASISNSTVTTKNGSNQSTTSSVQSLGGNIGHALSKTDKLGSGLLNMNLQQGLGTVLSTRGSPSTHLSTGGSLVWSSMAGGGITSISLRAVDSRSLTGSQNYSQLINLQASRNERLARNQSLIGNLTLQASRSGASGISTPFIATPRADLAYRHQRLFEIRNMTFESNLSIVGADIVSSQPAQGNTQNASVSWDNNVDYFIGRLKLRLYTHIAETNNQRQSSVFFNISRSF